MARKLTGRKLGAKNGTTVICITAWSLNPTNDVQDVTSSCSNGAKEYDAGLDGGDGSCTLVWPADKNPFEASGGGLKAGTKLDLTLELEVGSTAGDFKVPIIITGTPIGIGVGGRVEVTVNFNINGAIIYPTGVIGTGVVSFKGNLANPGGFVRTVNNQPVDPYDWEAEKQEFEANYEEVHDPTLAV